MMQFSAHDIARILDEAQGKPRHEPTEEQRAVIECADPAPRLVIAGAGSGKTTTLAEHLSWLVANQVVRPQRILGLTFTRKAAAELQEKVRSALRAIRPDTGENPVDDLMSAPQITTYNAYANRLFQDHALRIGREPDSALITNAAAWGLASEVVATVGEQDPLADAIVDLGTNPRTLIEQVLRLDALMVDNAVDPEELVHFARAFVQAIDDLPRAPKQRGGVPGPVQDTREGVRALPVLVPLCQEYERRKAARGLMEYGDQVAGASQIVHDNAEVREAERERWDVVVLDEYQDTSVSQIELLSTLFSGRRVLAVGDPNQSIYGWRGASAAGMHGFLRDFARTSPGGRLTLSTSWRNDTHILDAANVLITGLDSSEVNTLSARPHAGPGEVCADFLPDLPQETHRCAAWIAQRMVPVDVKLPTAAMLFRTKKHMALFAEALEAAGVPAQVMGLGGALDAPEVIDLRCALAVMSDAGAGPELVRLLSGARWRIGPGALQRLGGVAAALAAHGYGPERSDADRETIRGRMRASGAASEAPSLSDALEEVARPHSRYRSRFSDSELERFEQAAVLFRGLRRRRRGSLGELVRAVIQSLELDVELVANERRIHPGENLRLVLDKVGEYERAATHPTVTGLLAWFQNLSDREQLGPTDHDPERGTVQLLTIHAAKGLEWDIVCVPELSEGSFPTVGRDAKGWPRAGELPVRFRKDRGTLPSFPESGWADQKDLADKIENYREANREAHATEEQRLAYVAVTRARHRLLLTGAQTHEGLRKGREPSPFLVQIAKAWKQELPTLDPADTREQVPHFSPWPRDPLGSRRPAVERARDLVRAADANPAPETDLNRLITALLRERDDRARAAVAELPDRIAASHFHSLLNDPRRTFLDLTRPVPARPSDAGALGTAFHSWVQHRYEAAGWVDSVETDPLADDAAPQRGPFDPEALRDLQSHFLRSRWAGIRPIDVELALEYPLGGVRIPCKLDAVFEVPGGYEVVDWKTGRPPADARELQDRQYQLALYRLAYARYRGVAPDKITARFFYVAADLEVAPEHLSGQKELRSAWESVDSELREGRGSSALAGTGSGDATAAAPAG